MATYTPGPLTASISGAIGGLSFRSTRGSLTILSRRTHSPTASPLSLAHRAQLQTAQRTWRTISPAFRLRYNQAAATIASPNHPQSVHRPNGYQLFIQIFISHIFQAGLPLPTNPMHLTAPGLSAFAPQFTADAQAEVIVSSLFPAGSPGALISARRLYNPLRLNSSAPWRWISYAAAGVGPVSILPEIRAAIAPCATGDTIQLKYRSFLAGRRPGAPLISTLTVL